MSGSKSKPWYGRVEFKGRTFLTEDYATKAEAALAAEILEACLRIGIPVVEDGDKEDTP